MDETRLAEIARHHGVRLLLQFGSTVTGTVHARSDVDLAVLLEASGPSLRQLADLLHDLQELHPDREVDLAVINRADPLFLKRITDSGRLVYGEPRALHELRLYAFKRYQDHRRYLALERDYLGRALRVRTGS